MMPQVDFYLLAGSAQADKDRYACRIAALAHSRGLTVYIATDDDAHAAALDQTLWTFAQDSFTPHALYTGEAHEPGRYPVQIGSADAPADCRDVLVSLKAGAVADYDRFGRVVELILNDDGDKISGRERFRFYRQQGVEPRTHTVA